MLVEQRTYWLKPGSVSTFLSLYEAEGLAIQAGALGRLLGYYFSETGDLNRVIQLWGFDSFEDRTRRKAILSGNPQWKSFVGRAGSMIERQSTELLTPAPFHPSAKGSLL
uniref:NIPSNAP domain-containing protein n=1 Tax=Achromobacter xylosoxidans (strain A8) TaxID=762376 RepID=Q5GRD3_ACHXA|nr:NIPSNAP family protein [Achromobacter xylosoxidans]CAI47835.1 hypothetical protein [Achromobacter xylosoxidans A8]